ncbi:hypothetical protein Aph01nite_13060 [Acrocarpospora phusangensis]|uniref:Uncharacterized protein n=1 Tax=Acrocarpospora phusangensis TaxID=1070424 RepID=A0A919UIR9_9ACTN|nr:hypothetical protein [Acrocarpospora phusangensis]GIH22996.1 hypothetical protein Aph01nite_13060 [Acrocarpospora phusangensis]
MIAADRAREVHAATRSHWGRGGYARLERPYGDGGLLVVEREPEFVYGRDGELVGVDAWVQLFGADGRERKIDPHRRIINPPTSVWQREGAIADPVEAFYRSVADCVERAPHPRGWTRRRDRGTVTAVLAGTGDGFLDSFNATYNTARSGSNLNADTSNFVMAVGQDVGFSVYQSYVGFDTSAIPDADTVSAAVLSLWLDNDESATDFTVEARQFNWSSGGLTTADWIAGASLSGNTLLASIATSGIGASGAYKNFTSEAALLTATGMKTGTVYMNLSSSRTRTGTAPSGGNPEYVLWAAADASSAEPTLTITHAGAALAPPMFTSRPPRVWKVY